LKRAEEKERYRWVILIIIYLSMLAFGLIFQSIPPILPFITSELHLTYAQSGLLMGLFALPGVFITLLGGFLSDRYGVRRLSAGCFLLMFGGVFLVGLGRTLWILWLGRLISGIGAFTLVILLPKIISEWFREKELGLAMGLFNTCVPLSSVICFNLLGRIGSLWGWRVPILSTGIYAFIPSILFLSFYRPSSSQVIESKEAPNIYKSVKNMGSSIWWLGLSWLWFHAAFISFSTFGPDYFLRMGYTIEQSDFFIGIPPLGALLLSTPVGYLLDRIRHKEWFIGVGGIALAGVTFSFNFTSSHLLLVALMGFFCALIPTSIYSLPPEIVEKENLGLAFGILSTCSSTGAFVAPYFVGKIEDLTGSNHWSFILIPLFSLFILISIFFSYRSRIRLKGSLHPSQVCGHE